MQTGHSLFTLKKPLLMVGNSSYLGSHLPGEKDMVATPTLQLSSAEVRALSWEVRGLACRYYRTYRSSYIFPLQMTGSP